MRRREFIKHLATSVCVAHQLVPGQAGLTQTEPSAVQDARTNKRLKATKKEKKLLGEWPMPGQNNRYLAQAELPCNMQGAPKEMCSYNLGRVPIGALFAPT